VTRWTDYLLVNAATMLWAGNVVLGRALRHDVGPWTLAGVRAAVASVLFAALLARQRPGRPRATPRDRLMVFLMALSGVVGFQVLFYSGLRLTTAINAGLVNATAPLITLVLARTVLRQPLARPQALGALVSLAGVAVILSGGSWATLAALRFNPGDLLVLAAVTLWAVYSVAGRQVLGRQPTVWVTATSTMLAVPLLAGPAALEWSSRAPNWSPGIVAAFLYIGAGPSFLAFLAWNEGVRRLGPNGAMAFYNTLPLYTGLLAAVSLAELPGLPQIVGGLLVVAGCLAAARSPSPRIP